MTAVRSPTGLLYRGSRGLSRASGDAGTSNSKRNGQFTLSSVGGAQKSTSTNVAVFLNSRRAGSFLPTGTTRTTGSGMKRGRSRERDARAVWVAAVGCAPGDSCHHYDEVGVSLLMATHVSGGQGRTHAFRSPRPLFARSSTACVPRRGAASHSKQMVLPRCKSW